jgi:hypothetical protein
MPKKTKYTKCKDNSSVFDYSLLLKPNGTIQLFDKKGKPLASKGTTEPPKIKKILNVRTLTIVEAEGSRWVWVHPPGAWIKV